MDVLGAPELLRAVAVTVCAAPGRLSLRVWSIWRMRSSSSWAWSAIGLWLAFWPDAPDSACPCPCPWRGRTGRCVLPAAWAAPVFCRAMSCST